LKSGQPEEHHEKPVRRASVLVEIRIQAYNNNTTLACFTGNTLHKRKDLEGKRSFRKTDKLGRVFVR
jgi:hypothetical protein